MTGMMKTLVVEKDGTLQVREVPVPRYTQTQALVKMISSGICNGTDAKLIHKAFKGVEDDQYPLMLGHEGVGEVVETGSRVTGLKPGDRVLLPFGVNDPELYGDLHSVWGAFSEYAVVDDSRAKGSPVPECAYAQTVLPEWVDPVDASMIVTLREVLSSIKRFGIRENNSVAVFGCGPVGMTFIRFLSLLGAHPIIAFDIKEEKLEEALKNGADYAFNSARCDIPDTIHSILPRGIDFTVDAVGYLPLINESMKCLRDGGKTCCYGISPETEMKLEWAKAPYNWKLHFQQFPSKAEEGEATAQILAWLKAGAISLKDFISDYFDCDHILDAFQKLAEKKIAGKGIVVYGDYREKYHF